MGGDGFTQFYRLGLPAGLQGDHQALSGVLLFMVKTVMVKRKR
jgi:hypothetical protein